MEKGKKEYPATAACAAAADARLSFQCNKWGKVEKGICWTFFPLFQKNNDIRGTKKKRPTPTANTAGTCLSVVNIGNGPMLKVPRHLYLVNCF